MSEQTQLTFVAERAVDPGVADLVSFLRGRDWLTAAEVSAATGWDDRRVRELAAGSDEVISYPGSRGYKLLAACTHAEYEHYRLARRHQARAMLAKVIRTDRIFYRRPAASL